MFFLISISLASFYFFKNLISFSCIFLVSLNSFCKISLFYSCFKSFYFKFLSFELIKRLFSKININILNRFLLIYYFSFFIYYYFCLYYSNCIKKTQYFIFYCYIYKFSFSFYRFSLFFCVF
jgi:hypothetical protein